jgi:uncharacterized protein
VERPVEWRITLTGAGVQRIRNAISACFLVCLFTSAFAVAQDMKSLGIATGSTSGTYFQIGKDIERIVSEACHVPFTVYESPGALKNLWRLRHDPSVQLATVQQHVLDFIREKRLEDRDYLDWVDKFRYIFALYPEEIHIVTRKTSGITTLRDLQNRRVSLGPEGSGTWMVAAVVLERGDVNVQSRFVKADEALDRLFLEPGDQNYLDAFFMVTGKPFSLLSGGNTRLNELTLVAINDERLFGDHAGFTPFRHARITNADYPWLNQDVETAATTAVLMTFNFLGNNRDNLAMVARLIKDNLDGLQKTGHAKWNEVRLDQPIPGWERYQSVVERMDTPVTECRFGVPGRRPVPEHCKNLPPESQLLCSINAK